MKIEITEVSEVGYLPRLELRADGKFINSFSYTLDRDGQRRAEKLAEAMRLADEIMEKGNTQPITKLVYRYEDKIVYQEDGNYPLPPLPAEDEKVEKKEITMVISDPTRLEYFLKAAKIYLGHEPKYRELSIELDGVKDGYLVFLPTEFSESILCQHVFSIGITVGAISATSSLGKVEV
jgi:hypothetical protein